MDPHSSDRALVAALLVRQGRTQDVFFIDYSRRVYQFIFRRLNRDRFAAEDICQIVMSRAMRGLPSYRGESSLFTWLCQIARNEIATRWKEHRRGQMNGVTSADDEVTRREVVLVPAPECERPECYQLRAEIGDILLIALNRLPERYALVLKLKYIEGLSVQDIGAQLGSSEKAIQSMLARARSALRDILTAEGVTSTCDADMFGYGLSTETFSGENACEDGQMRLGNCAGIRKRPHDVLL